MSRVYWISDTHFNHQTSLGWRKQFKSVEEMNAVMVDNWNRTVKPEDTVYHLGDEFLGDSAKAQQILKSLNGYKILVKGNHSTKSDHWYHEAGFAEIYNMLYLISPTRPKIRYLITHVPVPYLSLEAMNSMGDYHFISIHGHVHDSADRKFTGDDIWKHPDSYINVCVGKTNYTPIELPL